MRSPKSILTLLKRLFPTHLIALGRRLLRVPTASDHYRIIPPEEIETETRLRDAWKDASIPPAQRAIVDAELRRMYQREVIPIFRILAEAVRLTHCEDTLIVEVGCATGHYSEVLTHLLGHSIRYVGIDYSTALLAVARRYYPHQGFALGDAVALPLAEQSVELLISGCVLLHVPDYARVIAESARVARQWVIFHRTPVVAGPTLHYTKQAYGVPCLEIVFGERELFDLFRKHHLTVAHTFEIDAPQMPRALDRGYGKTFVCRATR